MRQRDTIERQIEAYSVVIEGGRSKPSSGQEEKDSSNGVEAIGRSNSFISIVWDVVKRQQGTFGVKEIRPKLEALGRKSSSGLVSLALRRLVERGKLTEIKHGKNRWEPGQYALKN